jgi:hypothetical protein
MTFNVANAQHPTLAIAKALRRGRGPLNSETIRESALNAIQHPAPGLHDRAFQLIHVPLCQVKCVSDELEMRLFVLRDDYLHDVETEGNLRII